MLTEFVGVVEVTAPVPVKPRHTLRRQLVNIKKRRAASPRKLRLAGCNKGMMVEKGCESCREWQEHYYREHMDVSKTRFFQFMTGDFARGISIPAKFVKNFNGQITKGLDLKVPSGEIWHVDVDKGDNELLLTSGWKDFVKAHGLKENDLLIFKCRGKSSIEVLIFEASGCEKLSSLFANRIGPSMHKHLNDIAAQDAVLKPYTVTDTEEVSVPPPLVGSTHMAPSSKKYNCKTRPTIEPQSRYSSNYHVKQEAMDEDERDDRYADSKYYYSRVANRLTEEEKENILSLASVQPENPAFVAVLQKNNRQRRGNLLIVPSTFAADHLQERTQEIILCRPSRKDKWSVRYHYTGYTRGFKDLQFFNFVHDNKLREGDICVFELWKGAKRVTMAVHVIRKFGLFGDRFFLLR